MYKHNMEGLNEPIPTITTDYEAFEFVARKLLEQNEKSMTAGEDCAYRGYKDSDFDEARIIAKSNNELYDEIEDEYLYAYEDAYQMAFDEYLHQAGFSLKCAAGWLIADNQYSSDLEGKTAEDSFVAEAIINSNPAWLNNESNDSAFELLTTLQFIHDRRDPPVWAKKFEMLKPYFDEDGKFDTTRDKIIGEGII